MTDASRQIADKVRGVAAETQTTQSGVASILGIDRKSVHARWHGRVPFSAAEIFSLSAALGVEITRFFPHSPSTLKSPASSDVTSAPSGGAATSVRAAS